MESTDRSEGPNGRATPDNVCKIKRKSYIGPPLRRKRDGVIGHISKRENRNWMIKISLLPDRSIWHPA